MCGIIGIVASGDENVVEKLIRKGSNIADTIQRESQLFAKEKYKGCARSGNWRV